MGILFCVRGGWAQGLTAKERATRDEGWRQTIRKELYVPAELPTLEAKTWSTFSPTPGVLADRVTYQTMAGMVVPAVVYRPDPAVVHWKGNLPGIVVVNGHGSDKFGWYAFYSGMMFAKAGAVVVTYDPIGEGERKIDKKSGASSHDKMVETPAGVPAEDWGQRLAGLMQVDVLQAVHYLSQQPGGWSGGRGDGISGDQAGGFDGAAGEGLECDEGPADV